MLYWGIAGSNCTQVHLLTKIDISTLENEAHTPQGACDLKNKSCWELNFPIFNFKTLELRTASPRDAWKKWSQRINKSKGNETGRNRFATKSLELNPQNPSLQKNWFATVLLVFGYLRPVQNLRGTGFFLHLVFGPKNKDQKRQKGKRWLWVSRISTSEIQQNMDWFERQQNPDWLTGFH